MATEYKLSYPAAEINEKLGKIVDLDTTLTHEGEAADAKATGDAVGRKVDKVDGKGLSSNDYDNAAKAKVDAIPENPQYTDTVYDDTEVKRGLSKIKEDLATLQNAAETPEEPGKVWGTTNDGAGWINATSGIGNYVLIERIIVGYSSLSSEPADWNENYQAYFKNTGTASEPIYSQLSVVEPFEQGKFFEFDPDSIVNIERMIEPNGIKYSYSQMLVNVIKKFSDVPTIATNGNIGFYYNNGVKNYSNQNCIGWAASKKGQRIVEVGNKNGFYKIRRASIEGNIFGPNNNVAFTERPLIQNYVNPIDKLVIEKRYPNEVIEIYGVRA